MSRVRAVNWRPAGMIALWPLMKKQRQQVSFSV
jgi:hypothetical protein